MNYELKREFVEEVYTKNNDTYKTYLSILNSQKTKRMELQFNKDIYEFNRHELE